MSEPDKPTSKNQLTNTQNTASYLSGNSTPNSFRSENSQTPLTMDIPDLLVPQTRDNPEHDGNEEDTTYFLLDIQTPDNESEQERYSRSPSLSSSSSESAQIVIDSGILRPSQYDHGCAEDGRQHQLSESPHGEDIHPMEVPSLPTNGHSSGKDGNRIMTIYTEEEDDLMDEMPRWNQEVMHRRHSLLEEDSHAESDWAADKNGHRNRRDRQNSYISSNRRESSFSRNPGLSSEEALSKLYIRRGKSENQQRHTQVSDSCIITWIIRPETIICIISVIILLAFYIIGYKLSDPYQTRVLGSLIEGLLILAFIIWNGWLYRREQRLTLREVTDRAQTIIEALERSGMNMVQDTRIPFIPSLSIAKVVRDGVSRVFPTNLLVEGDVIEMLYGDVAPSRMKYVYLDPIETIHQQLGNNSTTDLGASLESDKATVDSTRKEYYMAADQVLKPSFFGVPPHPHMMRDYMTARGRHQFILLETPLRKNMRKALQGERPETVIHNEAKVLINWFYHRIIWAVLALALIINLFRFGFKDIMGNKYHVDQIFEVVFVETIYTIIPLLPLTLPSLWLIARSFGNAQVLILFEALQISKTEYEDEDDVDEFDAEAPPPTKDVDLNPNAVWSRFFSLLTKWDKLSLTRSTNLFESLGSTTVICCLDKEGTIANPFPSVEQILLPNDDEDVAVLDVEEDYDQPYGIKFEDQDWDQYLAGLKPVGLNFLLNTNCGVLQGRRRAEHHRKRSGLHSYGKTLPARQSCLCRLGKTIGFTDDALSTFQLRKEIYTFAPYHEVLNAHRNFSQQFEVPSMLSTIYEETRSGSYQLLSDGHLDLILDKCSDYWDGQSLRRMTDAMEKKVYDLFQNAQVNDMQCIAYAYRPINTTHGEKIPFLQQSGDYGSDPGCAFIVLPYNRPSTDSSSVSSASTDTDTQGDEDDDGEQGTSTSVGAAATEASSTQDLTRKRPYRHRSKNSDDEALDFSFQDVEQVNQGDEERFYKEVVKGQIFLGLATLCHRPKLNVVDFIEDLGLAGIRFVYFSPTAERESKAYAERLGLETDWNSCILLSNADDDNCGTGYLQTHDIKAQLPRGIDQIRPHLENVDDIPLHVSLFAECTPYATTEMIRIFQENGEVVCCVGNALNAKNTASFALADVSIAMEPMHTRAQTKGRLALGGRQPPLAIGASLVSLPCGLFMQYETSLYALTQLTREARRLLNAVRMMLWIMWIVLPILTISMLFSPHEDNIMLMMPGKNINHVVDRWRFMTYFVLRFALPIIMSVIIYVLCLIHFLDGTVPATEIFGDLGTTGWLHWNNEIQWAVLYAQNCTMLIFVWYIACISATFLHRTLSMRRFLPFRNRIWIIAFFTSIALQFAFCAVSLAKGPYSIRTLPWYVYFLGFAFVLVIIPAQELVKLHDLKEFTRFQKRSKLEFSTKLGMHSPL
ncbi:hypothetical protein INT44_003261 [Umbelopsis vinacea]|uniref:Cation-transporting P-type ATPase C-terminal domain-containing protein n=1 Tax=Umbelopsis vinacea TaxID=44442 RepID=A0A8H7Q8A0_9FUNG|nr:hypothetical protein INT44_003261 [Umbelopsis vinacea]